MTLTEQILSQLPGNALAGLQQADHLWQRLKDNTPVPIQPVIQTNQQPLEPLNWDVVISSGTLGILLGAALAQLGWRVALIERGILRGRDQEWNISRPELNVFLELNLLSRSELDQAIATEYNPARVSFFGGKDVWVRDVLNIGIDPVYLLETLKAKFLAAGGHLFEHTAFSTAVIHPDGVAIHTSSQVLKTRLLIDAMGHFSPIVKQVRQGQTPDGVCLVVGSCAQGYPVNETGDLIVSFTPIKNQCQYFWEAFPAREGRTTYLFTYLDPHPDRLSLTHLFEEYLSWLPEYQKVELAQLKFVRSLFGFFPSYRQSPLRSPWSRLLFVGDSSGNQSPLSFGGFGAMLRHLKRLTQGIDEALKSNTLSNQALGQIQPYQPNLSVSWLFQRAMMVPVNQTVDPNQINRLLAAVFAEMAQLGDPVLKPFLQDVVQFPALSQTLLKTGVAYPGLVAQIIPQVGLLSLLDWMRHYINLGIYSSVSPIAQALEPWIKTLSPEQRYYCHQWLQALRYGSGGDYHKTQDFGQFL